MSVFFVGSSTVGSYPLGIGNYNAILSKSSIYLMPDLTQGEANFIDPTTGDFIINMDDGAAMAGTAAQQLVYLRLFTAYESSILEDFGIDIIGDVINERTPMIVRTEIERTLSDIVDNGTIEIINIAVATSGETIDIVIEWKDLKRGSIHSTILNF